MDYVRTVSFHHEYPWILSASDDQTIRIWNWQSRQSIAVLTGHSHYVMCAAFHPTEDLIASASLDQTIRVWDMSNLCKKYTSPHSQSIEEDIVRASSQPAQNDIFGSTDVVLKYNIESHDRGVNWVAWHPTKPLLASAGDDQAIKITKLLGTKYWTDGTAYGHSKNVSCVVYHPRQNLLMSVSEDKTLRVWDGAKYTQLLINERENDRYWILVAHPTMSLFATGHDSGVTIFKLDRERPAHTIYQDELFWIDTDKNINTLSLKAGSSGKVVGSLKKIGHKWNTVYSLSYNPAEKAILAVSGDNDRMYELVMLPREVGSESTESRTGEGDEAVWIARNRFAVLKKQTNSIEIRDLGNTLTRTVTVPKDILGISAAKPNIILLRYAISVKLFGIQKKLVISELAISGIKYTYWSLDGNYVALMGKQLIAIATKELKLVCETREPIRLKSAAWNEDGVLIYSTLDHLRYILPNGDKGIIKTLQDPLYLIQVRRSHAYGLDREARPRVVSIDPTDFKFKMALIKGDQKEMLRIIHNSDLVGQSIIAYLSKKGYPDVALNFVQDVKLRFELAIECGKIDIALETATSIDDPKVWQRLAKEAAYQGNHKIMELCYQKLKDFSSLSFLYLVTGNKVKLDKMTKIAEHRGDMISVFQNSLLLGNVSARVKLLRECGLDSLAYATAKLNGLTDEASNILAECGKSEEDVDLPSDSEALPPVPEVKRATYEENWPMKERQETAFERVLLENSELAEPAAALLNKDVVTVDAEDFEQDEEVQFADVDGGDDWDVDNELNLEDLDISKDEMKTTGGVSSAILSENEYWVRNSMLPAHHIAGGSFETAMQLLSRQLAVIRFEPLKARFTEIYEASRAFVPTAPLLPSLVVYNSKPLEKMVSTNLEPFVPRTVSSLEDVDIPEAYRLVKVNKLPQAVEKFRSILYVLNTASVSSKSEIERVYSFSLSYADAYRLIYIVTTQF